MSLSVSVFARKVFLPDGVGRTTTTTKPQSSLDMPRTHSGFIMRSHALPSPISRGPILACITELNDL